MRYGPFLIAGAAAGSAIPLSAQAAELAVKLELPEITTGLYMKPYVSLFLEKDDDTFVRSLSLWHQINPRRGPPREGGPGREGPPGEGAGPGGGAGGPPQFAPGGPAGRTGGPPAGDRYLNSLRDWWRSSGTTSQMPIDGVSSATRGAGTHEVVFTPGKAPLNDLPPGKYQLVVEVAREVKGPRPQGFGPGEGGPPRGERGPSRDALEELRIAFEWPVRKETTLTARGKAELGAVSLTLKP